MDIALRKIGVKCAYLRFMMYKGYFAVKNCIKYRYKNFFMYIKFCKPIKNIFASKHPILPLRTQRKHSQV